MITSVPLKIEGWRKHLAGHPDTLYKQTIFDIIQYGAKIGYTGPDQFIFSKNLSSAKSAPDIITKDLEKQVASDRVTKVVSLPQQFISSPLGLVPKPRSNGWRRIHHLSHPEGQSVNDYIPEEWGTIEYPTVDEAIRRIQRLGPGCMLVKRDFTDAYRHIPVAKSDWWKLGFEWDGTYWFERFLPFGLRTSAFLFDLFAKGVNWIMLQKFNDVIHYLDDFLSILPTAKDATEFDRDYAEVCKELGFVINHSKSLTGTTVEFLGIELDTIRMEARLSETRLQEAITRVKTALRRPSISRDELESLVGFLSFAAKVVIPGRAFLRRLFNELSQTRGPFLHINQEIKADLLWWHCFLPKWNGIRFIYLSRPTLRLWTDASGEYGMGAYILKQGEDFHSISCQQAFSQRFTTRLRGKYINVKEMTAILHALQK